MSLLLTESRDQALLALAIQEASDAVKNAGGYVGRTAIQKVMYFLQVSGVSMNYRFDIHYYGPYCNEITRDAEWLAADEVIQDASNDASKYSNYVPGNCIGELLKRHPEVEECREHVRGVVQALTPLQPSRLELLATLDYLYRQQKATRHSGSPREAVVNQFMEIKGAKFSQQEVERTYDAMAQVGLMEAA